MIQPDYTSQPYVGWTSAYSLLSILLQLQSFLFAENIPQDFGGPQKAYRSEDALRESIAAAREFWYEFESYDGSWVKHTHDNPWPPLPKYNGPAAPRMIGISPKRGPVDPKVNTTFRNENIRRTPPRQQQQPSQYNATRFSSPGQKPFSTSNTAAGAIQQRTNQPSLLLTQRDYSILKNQEKQTKTNKQINK